MTNSETLVSMDFYYCPTCAGALDVGYECTKCDRDWITHVRAQQKAPVQDVKPVAWRVCNIDSTKFFTDENDAEDWRNLFEYTGITPLYERPAPPPSEVLKTIDDRLENICHMVFDTKLDKAKMRRYVRNEVNALADDIKSALQQNRANQAGVSDEL
jgi:hypothetical protein